MHSHVRHVECLAHHIPVTSYTLPVQADVPAPPMEEENQFQQITAARKYIAEQALKQQTKKVRSICLSLVAAISTAVWYFVIDECHEYTLLRHLCAYSDIL